MHGAYYSMGIGGAKHTFFGKKWVFPEYDTKKGSYFSQFSSILCVANVGWFRNFGEMK
jgi:hypothetical protein